MCCVCVWGRGGDGGVDAFSLVVSLVVSALSSVDRAPYLVSMLRICWKCRNEWVEGGGDGGRCECLCRDGLVVRTLRCGRINPGSNPGHGRRRPDFCSQSPQSLTTAGTCSLCAQRRRLVWDIIWGRKHLQWTPPQPKSRHPPPTIAYR